MTVAMTVRDSCNDSLNLPKSLICKRNDRYDGCDSFSRVLSMVELQGLAVTVRDSCHDSS